MKTKAIYMLMAAALAFSACDEVEEMTGKPQVNPAVPGYDISQLKVSSPLGETLSLPALNAASDKNVAVLAVADAGNLPEGYTLSAVYELAADETFANPYKADVVFASDSVTGCLSTSEIENAYEAFFGLKADPEKLYGRAALYAGNEKGNLVRLGGADTYYAAASFTLTPDPTFVLYTPGDSNGWDGASSMQLPSTDGKNFAGFVYLKGSFKFTSAPGWDGTNYGAGAAEGELSTDGGAANLSVAEEGLYWASVNTADLTYTLSNISSLGVIGDFNGWGGDAVMTHNDSWTIWTADVEFAGTGEWKIRANNDWKISFGTSLENMQFNGGNLPAPGAGIYTVTFDISKTPYTATCVAR